MARSERRGLWWRVLPFVLGGPSLRRPDRCHTPRLRDRAACRACLSQPARPAERFTRSQGASSRMRRRSATAAVSYSLPRAGLREHRVRTRPGARARRVRDGARPRQGRGAATAIASSHTIGSATYARYDGDVARTFARRLARRARPATTTGYWSAPSSGSPRRRSSEKLLAPLPGLSGFAGRNSLDYQCRHGLGHGFMIQTGYDLPTALSLCSGLGSGWDRVTCTERFVHGERQHPVRLPVVLARRGGSAVPVQSRSGAASALLLRARHDVDPAGREERLPANRGSLCRCGSLGGGVLPRLRTRRGGRAALPRLPKGSDALRLVRSVRGRLLLRRRTDIQRRGRHVGSPAPSSLLRYLSRRRTAPTAPEGLASW